MALAGYDLYYDPVSPLFGVQSQLPVMLVEYTLRTPQDVEDYLALLEDMPRYFGLAAQVAGQRAEAGLFMSDHTLDKVLQQARAFLTPPEENYMVTTFPARIEAVEGLTGAERQAYAGRNLEAVAGPVYQAYAQLLDALEALRGSGRNEGGLAGLPAGRQYYELLAQAAVGTDRTVPQMQQTLQSMAAGSLARMRRLAAADEGLAGRYERYQPAAASPDEMLQDLKEKMAGDFPALEGAAYVLKTVDPALQQTLSPAFYMVPPLDDYENNTIYINPASAGRDLYPTLAHEGWPGHLYQSVYFRAQQPSPLRGALGFSGYDEGWATYVELEYAYAYSGRDEALAAFSAANEAAALALYGLVDIGVNYDGWGREQTAAFVEEYFGGQPGLADWLFDVVVEEPADYLKYAVGYAEFLGLRVQAQEALGAAYDPAAFHAFVLGGGPMPFPVLQGRLNEWLAGQTF